MAEKLNWIPIDKKNIPKGAVLLACFDKKDFNYSRKAYSIIHISYNGHMYSDQYFTVTHYVGIDKFDLK